MIALGARIVTEISIVAAESPYNDSFLAVMVAKDLGKRARGHRDLVARLVVPHPHLAVARPEDFEVPLGTVVGELELGTRGEFVFVSQAASAAAHLVVVAVALLALGVGVGDATDVLVAGALDEARPDTGTATVDQWDPDGLWEQEPQKVTPCPWQASTVYTTRPA